MLPLSLARDLRHDLAFPGEAGETAFWIIVGSMIAIVVGMVSFFRWRHWL